MKRPLSLAAAAALTPSFAQAHCPLCTVGAGAAAGTAAYFGVGASVLGAFIAAFAVAVGLWFARVVPKKVPLQTPLIVGSSLLLTVLPLNPLLAAYKPLYLPFVGVYGTTLALNTYLIGAGVGAAILLVSPRVSDWLTELRENKLPYQTMALTFVLLLLAAIPLQVWL